MTSRTGSRPRRVSARRGSGRSALACNPYGLTLREVRAEASRCLDRGWQLWEIRHRFTNDRNDPETSE
ncbi:hypothetical protein ABZU94_07310 [Streptomyces mirabilis]|uniref:hypothetical protein n=1 Tax=Streptomyces sp. NPDC005388 TaxID=3156717 RepID=UPI0033AE189A